MRARRAAQRWVPAVVATAVLTAGMASAMQGPDIEYSADAYMETSAAVMEGPAHFAPGKERREYHMNGMTMVTITRRDKHVVWSLMPEEKMYSEMPMSDSTAGAGDLTGYSIEQTRAGTETLDGVQTTKSKIIMTSPTGEKLGGFMWVTPQGIVVKMDAIAMDKNSKERIKSELKHLQIAPQAASLFEIPAGYTRMDMGGLGSVMMGGGGGDDDVDDAKPPQKSKKRGFGLKDAIDLMK